MTRAGRTATTGKTPPDAHHAHRVRNTVPYSERFEDALVFAHRLHREQTRKGSRTPYVTHLLAVAAIVGENGGDEDQVIAALLHDAVEDQGGTATAAAIEQRYGARVSTLVRWCSDSLETLKPPWRKRKEAFLDQLDAAPEEALLVVLADKIHNAWSIVADLETDGDDVWARFRGGRDGTLWYYRSAASVLRTRSSSRLVRVLDRLVARMEKLAGSAPQAM